MSGAVRVALARRTPSPRRVWDQGAALGLALLARHPDVDVCEVAIHGNARAGLAWRIGPTAQLSVHWALLADPDGVLSVLAGDPGAWERLSTRLPSPRPQRGTAAGAVHDLTTCLAEALAAADALGIEVPLENGPPVVTWGRFAGRPPRRTLRLGSCTPGDPPVVRIHPVLDHETVPGWFVSFVVFHELLHLAFPPVGGGATRRAVHPPALLAAEADHPDRGRAVALERALIGGWLERCRRAVRR